MSTRRVVETRLTIVRYADDIVESELGEGALVAVVAEEAAAC